MDDIIKILTAVWLTIQIYTKLDEYLNKGK